MYYKAIGNFSEPKGRAHWGTRKNANLEEGQVESSQCTLSIFSSISLCRQELVSFPLPPDTVRYRSQNTCPAQRSVECVFYRLGPRESVPIPLLGERTLTGIAPVMGPPLVQSARAKGGKVMFCKFGT